jgi:predicted MPP superfamily phosphohydrolase
VTIPRQALGATLAGAGALAAWGWFEAGWARLRTLEAPLDGLPQSLDGLRLVHLSDFHLGLPSRGARAVERGVDWAAARSPDLVCVTGDLLSHPRAATRLRELLARLDHPILVLGNHDVERTRDPFSRAGALGALPGTLLLDEAVTLERRGHRVQLVGVEPRAYHERRARPERLADPGADLRILLCHFPGALDRVPPGSFHLVLTGHFHAGQIAVPLGRRRVGLAHPRARYGAGLYRRDGTTMHVSPGLGTTFVPFRFLARPEATELVLRAGR